MNFRDEFRKSQSGSGTWCEEKVTSNSLWEENFRGGALKWRMEKTQETHTF